MEHTVFSQIRKESHHPQVERSESPPQKIHFNKEESCILLRLDNEVSDFCVYVIREANIYLLFLIVIFVCFTKNEQTLLFAKEKRSKRTQET